MPATALAALLAIGVVAATNSPPGRSQVLHQIEQPAVSAPASAVPPKPYTVVRAGSYRLGLRLAPNRASQHGWLSVELNRHGLPVKAARVTVTYSMPSMKMWRVLTSRLRPARSGTYLASQPVLGMAGSWQLNLTVAPSDAPAFQVTINDQMSL